MYDIDMGASIGAGSRCCPLLYGLQDRCFATKAYPACEKQMKECELCGKTLTVKQLQNKYCSSSCSAKVTNARRGVKQYCASCNTELSRSHGKRKFCNHTCQHDFYTNQKIMDGTACERTFRKYLLKTRNNKCNICNSTSWLEQPIPLEVDHIDGNSTNNSLDNLRLICPNCHAQTSTYKNRNKGNGRAKRRQRYAEGKSY